MLPRIPSGPHPKSCTTWLAVWMRDRRVSNALLAERCGVSAQTIQHARSGARRPKDDLKTAIAAATRLLEIEQGLANGRGVIVADWFKPAPDSRAI